MKKEITEKHLQIINQLAMQVLINLTEQNIFDKDSEIFEDLKSIAKLCQLPETISDYSEEKPIRMKTLNSVKASKFLDWYFSDASEIRDFGSAMIEQLETFGTADISVEQLFDGCALIPQYICEDWDEDWGNEQEYSPEQIELINYLK
jgi:hypothetical protein